MIRYFYKEHLIVALYLMGGALMAQTTVKIDPSCQHYIGGVSQLDRGKYFSIHDNGSDPDQLSFRNEYHVTGGRYFYSPLGYAKNQTGSVGTYPPGKDGDGALREVNQGYVATEHPANAFVDGLDIKKAAAYAVEYYKDVAKKGGNPEFYEVMNEPFVHAKDFYSGGWSNSENDRIKLQMAQLYNEVGKEFKAEPALANMKVIGYSSAWPSMELNDFGHWNENMKLFMDTAGENMYGFSTHLYDGINVAGQDNKRSGSNSEAILDLIESYSYIKWDWVKPHAITEYGAIEKGYGDDYSDIASAQTLRSINHILFQLMDRQDRLAVSIPFITGKAQWHINAANNYQPYGAALWIPTNIGEPDPVGWRYSPRIHFYELWQNVKGERIMIKSDNPDVQVQAFVDGDKMYVGLNNLDENDQTVDLSLLSELPDLDQLRIKSLKVYNQDMPDYSDNLREEVPSSITLIKDETVVLEYSFKKSIVFENALRTKTYYTKDYLKPIISHKAQSYSFNNVDVGDGFATLRMSIGRKHSMSKQPVVKVNGTAVSVPNNWKGYDQANRDDFFGTIEIPLTPQLLKKDNTVTLEFPDSGGRVSSLILQVDKYDNPKTLFRVGSIDNPCPGTSKGTITIDPMVSGSYTVHVTGNNLDENHNFSSTYSIDNLDSGIYELEITSASDPELDYKYTLVISEPENLSVNSIVDYSGKKVNLVLKGGKSYEVSLNGRTITTDRDKLTLDLKKGENNLFVKAHRGCQGIHSENIVVIDGLLLFPNPIVDQLHIVIPPYLKGNITCKLYAMDGRLLRHKKIPGKLRDRTIDLSGLAKGAYIVGLSSPQYTVQSKVVKK